MENIKRRILADSLGTVQAAITKLARRAGKLGVPVPVLTHGDVYGVKSTHPVSGEPRTKFYVDVELANAIVKLPNWNLVAALDHAEKTVRVVPDAVLPTQYRGAASLCDHCQTKRTRNTTYVLVSAEAKFVQVGSNCIKDFLGHDGERAVRLGEFSIALGEFLEEGEEGFPGGNSRSAFTDLEFLLAWTLRVVAVSGFFSKKAVEEGRASQPTSQEVAYAMDPPESKRDEVIRQYPMVEGMTEKALAIIEWAKALTEAEVQSSDYLYNVHQVAENGFTTRRSHGVAVSMVAAYNRAQSDLVARSEAIPSKHFGTVGERAVYTLTVTKLIYIEGQFGTTTLHMFKDQDGNAAKWFSSTGELADIGETRIVKATVKNHEQYKGSAQTTLSRVQIYEPKPPKARAFRTQAAPMEASA